MGVVILLLIYLLVRPASTLPLREEMAKDKSRPQYHFLPAQNWMNDPCGPIFFDGVYHMFYQFNPQLPVWGNMSWGHAESMDMIHWRHDPLALWPSTWYDALGVFSGSIAADEDHKDMIDMGRDSRLLYAYYTAVHIPTDKEKVTLKDGVHPWREIQASAVSRPYGGLRDWTKQSAESSMVFDPPFSYEEIAGFRDPAIKFDSQSQQWLMLIGSGKLTEGGSVVVYSSGAANLKDAQWSFSGVTLQGTADEDYVPGTDPVSSDYMWECPDLVVVGSSGLHMLIYGTCDAVFYSLGSLSWRNGYPQFEPLSSLGVNTDIGKQRAKLDHGLYYAARFQDMGKKSSAEEPPVVWGWVKEPPSRTDADLMRAGWAGVMSLPRALAVTAVPDEQECGEFQGASLLRVAPAAAVETLRLREASTPAQTLSTLPVLSNLSAEIMLQLAPLSTQSDGAFTLDLSLYPADTDSSSSGSSSNNGDVLPFVAIHYAYLYVEQEQRFSAELRVGERSCRVPVGLPDECGGGGEEDRKIRVFIDGSVIEVFGGFDCVITARSYDVPPGDTASLRPALKCDGGDVKTCGDVVTSYDSWQIRPISDDRLTT